MNKKLSCIMLVDDNYHDNFFHEREIKKLHLTATVITKKSGEDALEYLKSDANIEMHPNLIFLDINMPGMNGWHFLEEYYKLDKNLQSKVVVVMLTTSDNPTDIAKAKEYSFVGDYLTKPLTKESMKIIIDKYFTNK